MTRNKGFTLVEAAVATGVVAILAGIIIPLALKSLRDSRRARARNDLQVIAGAIALELKDTGSRPVARVPAAAVAVGLPAGAAAPSGTVHAMWYSGGTIPQVGAGPVAGGPFAFLPAPGNTFTHLFTLAPGNPAAYTLFGFDAPARPGSPFGYRGPYLAADMAAGTDPWGHAYVILGFNRLGQESGGPIWVVSAGESGVIEQINLQRDPGYGALPGTYHREWDYHGLSATNIAIRVN